MPDLFIYIISAIVAVLFAFMGVLLHMTKGNRISDILKANPNLNDAIKVEIYNKLKVSSQIPIVAIYIVAAIVFLTSPYTSKIINPKQSYEVYSIYNNSKLKLGLDKSFIGVKNITNGSNLEFYIDDNKLILTQITQDKYEIRMNPYNNFQIYTGIFNSNDKQSSNLYLDDKDKMIKPFWM